MDILKQNYILEFSEVQQCFNSNFGVSKENTNTFVTVIKSCNDYEKKLLKSFLNFNDSRENIKFRLIDVQEGVNRLKKILENINKINMEVIKQDGEKNLFPNLIVH